MHASSFMDISFFLDETSSAAAVLSTILPTSVTKTIARISSSSSTGIISNSTPTSAGAGSQVKVSTLLVVSISLGLFLVALVVSGFSLLCFSRLCSMRKKRGESVRDGPIEAPPFQRMLALQQSLAGFDEALLNGLKLNDTESVSLSLASASPSLLNQLQPSIISKMMAEVSERERAACTSRQLLIKDSNESGCRHTHTHTHMPM